MTKVQTQESIENSFEDFINGSPEEFSSHYNVPFKKSSAEKKLLRKINWALLPFITIILFIQIMNKTTYSRFTFRGYEIPEIDLVLKDYAQIVVIEVTVFMISIFLNIFLIQKFRISRYLGVLLLIWGIVMCCAPSRNTFAQHAACSAFMAFCEAGILPSLLIVISSIYRRSEQPIAFGFLWAIEAFTITIYSLYKFGLLKADELSWDAPYYIWGGLTIAIALTTFIFFPDTANSFTFRLNEEEKEIVKERIKDTTAFRVNEIKIYQILEALKEPRFWFICIALFLNAFHTDVLSSFSFYLFKLFESFDNYRAFGSLPYAICVAIYSILAVLIARKSGQLYLGIFFSTTIALIGLILLATLPKNSSKLVGLFFAWATNGTALMLFIIIGVNVTGYTKKLFYVCMGIIFSHLGNYLSPYLRDTEEQPVYKTGMIVHCISQGVILVMLFFNRQLMAKQNKTKLSNTINETYDPRDDLTDRENKKFIYKL